MDARDRWDDIWSEKSRTTSGRLGSLAARDVIHRTVWGILKQEIPEPRGKRILEAGSGTGLVTLSLSKQGAEVVLLDLSGEAVRLSKDLYQREHAREAAVQASIIDLPFRDDSFDVTWNGGVIEHFEAADQTRILGEMLRVTKPGGKVIVIVPSSQARIYAMGKRWADRHGFWQPGYEVPMATLRDIAVDTPGRVVREYRTGLLAELHFLKYFFARPGFLRLAWCGLVEALSLILFPLNRLPGYLLASVLTKPPRGQS
jgi:SAM-dependent methyltransferase